MSGLGGAVAEALGDLDPAADDGCAGVAGVGGAGGVFAEMAVAGGVFEDGADCFAKLIGVAWGNEKRGDVVLDVIADAADVGDDERLAHGHVLYKDGMTGAEAGFDQGADVHRGLAIMLAELAHGNVIEDFDVGAGRGEAADRLGEMRRDDQAELCARRECADEGGEVAAGLGAGGEAGVGLWGGVWVGPEEVAIDADGDKLDSVGVEAVLFDQPGDLGLEDGDDGVGGGEQASPQPFAHAAALAWMEEGEGEDDHGAAQKAQATSEEDGECGGFVGGDGAIEAAGANDRAECLERAPAERLS
ncbi:MAG: hypothetical protein JWN40_4706 [Phycisphaerales bacterium]|nr:hypothetical protein [Phycisphaerales bacterium]